MNWNRHTYSTKYFVLFFVGITLILTGCGGGGNEAGSGGGGVSGGAANTPAVIKQNSLSVSTPNVSMAVGRSASLNAIMTYVDGTTADFTSQATWTSATPGVVSVGVNSGVLTGVSAGGPVTVTATLNGLTSKSIVMVSTVGVGSGNVMATGRFDHTASLLGSGSTAQVLVAGGYGANSTFLSSAELYNPNTNSWSSATPINVPRSDHTTVTLPDGRVLITGGMDHANIDTTELYDPVTATWTVTGPLNDGRSYNAIAFLTSTGQVMVAGGDDNSAITNANIINTVEIYTPVAASNAGTWVTVNPMSEARDSFTATFLPAMGTKGKVLVVGGFNYTTPTGLTSCELYDVATGTWSAAAPIPGARGFHTATLFTAGPYAGKVLVVGGMTGAANSPLATAELYDPVANTWTPVTPLTTGRYWHNAELLPADLTHPSGQVLVMGGAGSGGILASNELYDPVANTWTTAVSYSFTTARDFFTSTLIGPCASYTNGCVLSAGGTDAGSATFNSAELYGW